MISPVSVRSAALSLAFLAWAGAVPAQRGPGSLKVILDTDIGTAIDDAWALGLAMTSPEFELLAVTITDGDTAARARLACKLLHIVDRDGVPVAVGRPTLPPKGVDYQFTWAEDFTAKRPGAREARRADERLDPRVGLISRSMCSSSARARTLRRLSGASATCQSGLPRNRISLKWTTLTFIDAAQSSIWNGVQLCAPRLYMSTPTRTLPAAPTGVGRGIPVASAAAPRVFKNVRRFRRASR
jgi:inosine-uridine preferring nucleoside hydrolase